MDHNRISFRPDIECELVGQKYARYIVSVSLLGKTFDSDCSDIPLEQVGSIVIHASDPCLHHFAICVCGFQHSNEADNISTGGSNALVVSTNEKKSERLKLGVDEES